MQLLVLCLGLLAFAKLGESALAYVEPTGPGNVGVRDYLDQGATGTVYTLDVTTATAFAITAQVPAGVLEFTNTNELSLVSGQDIDYSASPTHVLTVTAGDGSGETGTITLTLSVHDLYFMAPKSCVDIRAGTAAAATLYTAAASGATTIVYSLSSAAVTGYTFTAGTGALAIDAAVTTSTTAAMVTTVIQAVESDGTATTASATVWLCINQGCTCDLVYNSGAMSVAAGLLSLFSTIILLKLQ